MSEWPTAHVSPRRGELSRCTVPMCGRVRGLPPGGTFGNGKSPLAIRSVPERPDLGPLIHLHQKGGPEITEPRIDLEDISLRVGLPEDAPKLAVVFVSAWRDAYPGIVSESSLMSLEETKIAEWLLKVVGTGDSTTTVAESSTEEVVGFCRYGGDPDDATRGHVFSLYVLPSASRRGVGSRLLAHALEDLLRQGLNPVTIWVFAANEPARKLYSAFGFSPDGAELVEPEYGAPEIRLRRFAKLAP